MIISYAAIGTLIGLLFIRAFRSKELFDHYQEKQGAFSDALHVTVFALFWLPICAWAAVKELLGMRKGKDGR